jgi:hypothetical protein
MHLIQNENAIRFPDGLCSYIVSSTVENKAVDVEIVPIHLAKSTVSGDVETTCVGCVQCAFSSGREREKAH